MNQQRRSTGTQVLIGSQTRSRLAALPAMLFVLSSCAATFGVGPFMVPIASDPLGATVLYQGSPVGVTPCTISMRNTSSSVELVLQGYHRRIAEVGTVPNGLWVFLGILLWGPFELLVDAAANSWSGVDDRPVIVPMVIDTSPDPGPWRRQ